MAKLRIPAVLKIKDKKLVTSLDNIIQQAELFWTSPLHPHYTDHGIEHSKRIISIMGKLLESKNTPLIDIEKFILLGGIFLHDIGMQSPKFSGVKDKTEYTHQVLEDIRDNHHETSAKMILESIKSSDLNLGFNNTYSRNFAPYVATISKYHRKLNLLDLEDISEGGKIIRMQLLAALLKFADELDVDYRRIVMDNLQIRSIPLQSKVHWWAHHFVQSLMIDKGKITVVFRYPSKCKKQIYILDYFSQIITEKINESFSEIYDILDKHSIRLHRDINSEEQFKPEGVLEPIPVELLEYLLEIVGIKKEIQGILPNKLADVVLEEIISSNLFNLEFDVKFRTADVQVEISMKIENPSKKFLFKMLGERPTRKQLEIIAKVKEKLNNDKILIPVKRSILNSNQEYEIFTNDDKSTSKLRKLLRSN